MWGTFFVAQMWCPPTPPVDDSDVYIDHALCFLYEPTIMSEAQLPPVYLKKERKRTRVESISEGKRFCLMNSKLPVKYVAVNFPKVTVKTITCKTMGVKISRPVEIFKIQTKTKCLSASVPIWPIQSLFISSSFIVHVNEGRYLKTIFSKLCQYVSVNKTRPTHCFERMKKNSVPYP